MDAKNRVWDLIRERLCNRNGAIERTDEQVIFSMIITRVGVHEMAMVLVIVSFVQYAKALKFGAKRFLLSTGFYLNPCSVSIFASVYKQKAFIFELLRGCLLIRQIACYVFISFHFR